MSADNLLLTLPKALRICRENAVRDTHRKISIHLAVGFTPGPLLLFLTAHAALARQDRKIESTSGVYGDMLRSVRETPASAGVLIVVMEWGDVDARLALRRFGYATSKVLADVIGTVGENLDRLFALIKVKSETIAIVLAPPALPMVPFFPAPGRQWSRDELAVRARVAAFSERCAALANVTVVNTDRLSPASERHALAADLGADMPYQTAFAAALAGLLVENALPRQPLKGLITDLDDTLWRGLVGEVGGDNVTWSLDDQSHIHALYQTVLRTLSEQGVLLAVASKNDTATAMAALSRRDIRVPVDAFFPIKIGWGPKSEAVARILEAWNFGAADVLFVDDNALELAEVRSRFPDIQTMHFLPRQDAEAFASIHAIRDLFGRSVIGKEDAIRRDSLKASAAVNELLTSTSIQDQDRFLESLQASLVFRITRDRADDDRPLALVNKTNQFNLNGERYESSEWNRQINEDPRAFLLTVDYEDKFGPLGTISVMIGQQESDRLLIKTWVLSCRAFSRRVEDATLGAVIQHFDPNFIYCTYAPTEKNAVVRDFLKEIGLIANGSPVLVSVTNLLASLRGVHHERMIHDLR